jgi:hypothetical protein
VREELNYDSKELNHGVPQMRNASHLNPASKINPIFNPASRNKSDIIAFALSLPLIARDFVSCRRDGQFTQHWPAPFLPGIG